MPYDPFENIDRNPALGKYQWVPSGATGNGVYARGWNYLVLIRGRFINNYYISDSDKTLEISPILLQEEAPFENEISSVSLYNPINKAFRKLQTKNKSVKVERNIFYVASNAFLYEILLPSTSFARISSITIEYAAYVNIEDPILLNLVDEQDAENIKNYLRNPNTTILNVEWSKYNLLTLNTLTRSAEVFDYDGLTLSGFYTKSNKNNLFEALSSGSSNYNSLFKTVTIKLPINSGSLREPSTFSILDSLSISNSSQTTIGFFIKKIMLFEALKVNIDENNLPCRLLSYNVPIEMSFFPNELVRQTIWPNNSSSPTFSIKVFHPDDTINARGFAHSLNIRFLIAGFPIYTGAFGPSLAGLLTEIATNGSLVYCVFVGPTIGKESSIYYLTANTLSSDRGYLIRVNNTFILESTSLIFVEKIDSPTTPTAATPGWKTIFNVDKISPDIASSSEGSNATYSSIEPWLFLDKDGTKNSWYRILQKNSTTNQIIAGDPFKGQIYTERAILQTNTFGTTNILQENIIRSVQIQTDYSAIDFAKRIGIFSLSPSTDDFLGSNVEFRRGLFKFVFTAQSEPKVDVNTHVFIRIWFHPGELDVTKDNPEEYRNASTELIFEEYVQENGSISTKISFGTPTSFDQLLVSAPISDDLNTYEINKYVDGLIDFDNLATLEYPTNNIVIGVYSYSYYANDQYQIDTVNPPNINFQLDAAETRLETTILKNQAGTLAASRFYNYQSSYYENLDSNKFYLTNLIYDGSVLENSPSDNYISYNNKLLRFNDPSIALYSYENLLTFDHTIPLFKQKIFVNAPSYSLRNDYSVLYYCDFVTSGDFFTNAKVEAAPWNIDITFDTDLDTSLIPFGVKVEAFFVDKNGQITERLFSTGIYDIGDVSSEENATFKILSLNSNVYVPFYVSGTESQLAFRFIFYPYSSTGETLNPILLSEIEADLNSRNKPKAIRILDIEITTELNSIRRFILNETVGIGTTFYEDLPILPNLSLDSQQFWFALSSDPWAILVNNNTDESNKFRVSGSVYSPTWFVELPENMEVSVRGNTASLQEPAVIRGQVGFRTVISTAKETALETRLSATELNLPRTVHIVTNSTFDNEVTILSDGNTVNYIQLNEPLGLPSYSGLIAGQNLNTLKGENPLVLPINSEGYQGKNKAAVAVLVENSDRTGVAIKIAVNNFAGQLNKWTTPTLNNLTVDFDSNLIIKYATFINKFTAVFDDVSGCLYIAGYVNPGYLIVKRVNKDNPGSPDPNATSYDEVLSNTIYDFNYIVDGPFATAENIATIEYDRFQVLNFADNLSGFEVKDTFMGATLDKRGRLMVAYISIGSESKITARVLDVNSSFVSDSFYLVELPSQCKIFCPVLTCLKSIGVHFIAFWSAGKIFVAKLTCIDGFNKYILNYVTLVAGSRKLEDETNELNKYLLDLEQSGRIRVDRNFEELDVPIQSPAIFMSENPNYIGQLVLYYKLSTGDLVARTVDPNGKISQIYKIV